MAQQQQLLLKFRIDDVRSKTFRYRSKKKQKIPWSRYDRAQENEFPEVVQLIRLLVDRASSQLVLPQEHDATGNTFTPKQTWRSSFYHSSTMVGATGCQ